MIKPQIFIPVDLGVEMIKKPRYLMKPSAKKNRVGSNGVRLRGNWSLTYQEYIISFWITHKNIYTQIKFDPTLQLVLESQIVQTKLIEKVHRFPQSFAPVENVFMSWVQLTLISQSEVILNYIKSIEDPFTSHTFMSTQFQIQPYGLKIDPPEISWDEIKIIQFWSTYMCVFLKMQKLGETPSLERSIGKLVKFNYKETSNIMRKFLIHIDEYSINQKVPVLAQFLQYFSELTEHKAQCEFALGVLSEFHKECTLNQNL
ncbi:uncharacterized protein MELLADRAFT_67042 [Melampsora larici-populina 98AG31]|uniref:Uncharacterized protein n=1 Tax=Melampsora larici-populina (strain 98AG31 / pathotype 3-4-7) TaxID=747676 RepID=F4S1K5_MELLP|nr:uncharacterized protein MELLADRAFT_67042 [Melampsora larici-populina 98AG31]EGG01392.1 hypothetical protein MELLADRAFT_67042 [Melampsora larici-populina 98AG31]